MRRRGVQKRGIGSETRRSHRERRKRRVDDVIDARRRSHPSRRRPPAEPPQTLSEGDIKRRLGRLCDDDCRRAGGTRAARKGANTRRPSVSDAETGPNAHSKIIRRFRRRAAGPFARQKRALVNEERRSATSNEGANGARFFAAAAANFQNRSVSQAGRTTDIFPRREILDFEVGKGQFFYF